MSRLIEVTHQGNLLTAAITGQFSLNLIHEAAKAISSAFRKYECSTVLVDITRMTGRIGVSDQFELVTLGETVQERMARTALWATEAQMAEFKFLETAAVNRGMQVKVFCERDAAIDWLNR